MLERNAFAMISCLKFPSFLAHSVSTQMKRVLRNQSSKRSEANIVGTLKQSNPTYLHSLVNRVAIELANEATNPSGGLELMKESDSSML